MSEKKWPNGYRTGFCSRGRSLPHRCTMGAPGCHCECHRVESNGQAPRTVAR